jgi:hypothetical protein
VERLHFGRMELLVTYNATHGGMHYRHTDGRKGVELCKAGIGDAQALDIAEGLQRRMDGCEGGSDLCFSVEED